MSEGNDNRMNFVNGLYVKRYKYFRLKWKQLFVFMVILLLVQKAETKHGHKTLILHDMTVSIHHSITEDKQIITNLQNVLINASKIFFQVTNKTIVFETIKIVIPHSWTYPATGKSFNLEDLSDIRIDNYHFPSGKEVGIHTVQAGECGDQGDYISMRPEFLHNKSSNHSASKLVQEIIRYRFGIFENLNLTKDSSEHHDKSQQMLCHGKTGWQILKKELNHTGLKTSEEFKNPTFEILKAQPGNVYMFLLDGSKDFWNKTAALSPMLTYLEDFRRHYAPKGSFVSYAAYDKSGRILQNFTEIWNDTTADSLLEEYENEGKEQHRNLTAGLETCLQELTKNGLPSSGARLILLTDDGWNVPHSGSAEYTHNMARLLLDNGIVLNTLIFGGSLHHHHHRQKLQELSHDTKGQFYVIKDETDVIRHGMAMLVQMVPEIIMVKSEELHLNAQHSHLKKEVYIETGMEKVSEIYISENIQLSDNIKIISPNGTSINSSYNMQLSGRQQYIFEANQAGKWSIQVANENEEKNNSKLQVQVIAKTTRNPVHLSAWIKQQSYDKPVVTIFAMIKSIHKLHHFNITAEVRDPTRKFTHIVLKDSGIGADVIAGDGIYSAYFVRFYGNGKYEVHIRASGKQNKHKAGHQHELFHRYIYAGSFWVHSKGATYVDEIPPAPIRDLTLIKNSLVNDKGIVHLNWTAVGDNMDYGKVASYELRITNLHKETPFGKWHRILSTKILEGSLSPFPSGQIQNVTFSLPSEMLKQSRSTHFYIAIKSHDHNNNPSALSNVVTYHIPHRLTPNNTTAENSSSKDTIYIEHNTNLTKVAENYTQTPEQKSTKTTSAEMFTNSSTTSSMVEEKDLNHINSDKKHEVTNNTGFNHYQTPKYFATENIENSVLTTKSEIFTSNPKNTTNEGHILKSPEIRNDISGGNESEDNINSTASSKSPEKSTESEENVSFAQINLRVSTIVASFFAGAACTFFVMVIIAAYVKNKKKKQNTYNIRQSEEDFVERMALKDEAL